MNLWPFGNKKSTENSTVSEITDKAEEETEELEGGGWEASEPDNNSEDIDSTKELKELEGKIEKLRASVEALKQRQEASSEKKDRMRETIGGIRENIKDLDKQLSEVEKTSDKAADIMNEVEPRQIQQKLHKRDAEHEEIKDKLEEKDEQITDIRSEFRELRSSINEIGSLESIKEMKKDTEEMLKTINKLENESKLHANKVEDMFVEVQNKTSEIGETVERQKELENEFENIKESVQELNTNYKTLPSESEFNDAIEDFEDKKDELDSTIPALEQAYNDVEHLIEKEVVTKQDLKNLRSDFEEYSNNNDTAEKIKEMNKRLMELEDKIERTQVEEKVDREELHEKIKTTREHLDRKIEKKINEKLPEDTEELEKMSKVFNKAMKEVE